MKYFLVPLEEFRKKIEYKASIIRDLREDFEENDPIIREALIELETLIDIKNKYSKNITELND